MNTEAFQTQLLSKVLFLHFRSRQKLNPHLHTRTLELGFNWRKKTETELVNRRIEAL